MKIKVLAFGQRMPAWVQDGINEYAKRIPATHKPEIVELAVAKRTSGKSVEQLIHDEDQRMLSAIKPADFVIALDLGGKPWSTEQLAKHWSQWQLNGADVTLLVGGPDGLGAASLKRANQHWSLSALTLPHPLVRVVLMEQFYRAWSIQTGHPYHK